MRPLRQLTLKQIDALTDRAADRRLQRAIAAVKASGSGQGLSGRLNASQPNNGLERLRRFNDANGRQS